MHAGTKVTVYNLHPLQSRSTEGQADTSFLTADKDDIRITVASSTRWWLLPVTCHECTCIYIPATVDCIARLQPCEPVQYVLTEPSLLQTRRATGLQACCGIPPINMGKAMLQMCSFVYATPVWLTEVNLLQGQQYQSESTFTRSPICQSSSKRKVTVLEGSMSNQSTGKAGTNLFVGTAALAKVHIT